MNDVTLFRFLKCIVKGEFAFSGTACYGSVTFAESQFVGPVDFSHAGFPNSVTFGECKFESRAEFTNATFNNARFDRAVFRRDVDFSADPDRKFESAIFTHARFEGTARFWRRRFTGITVFRAVHFEQPPEFFNAELPDEVDFEHATYGAMTKKNAYSAEAAYRTLKQKMNKMQHHRAETMFFAKEMCARQFIEKNKLLGGLYWVYGKWSDYGQSVSRPLVGLVVVAVISFLAYFIATEGPTIVACVPDHDCQLQIDRGWKLLELTFAGLIPFFEVTKQLGSYALTVLLRVSPTPGYIIVLQVLELVFSLLFLFLLGLAVRNLFRLK